MADPTLTERARAVLLHLDEQDRMDLHTCLRMVNGEVDEAPDRGVRLALKTRTIGFSPDWKPIVTDLGHEAARLLTEEVSHG